MLLRHPDTAGSDPRRRDSLMAEILEGQVRLHIKRPHREAESPEELTEDLLRWGGRI